MNHLTGIRQIIETHKCGVLLIHWEFLNSNAFQGIAILEKIFTKIWILLIMDGGFLNTVAELYGTEICRPC